MHSALLLTLVGCLVGSVPPVAETTRLANSVTAGGSCDPLLIGPARCFEAAPEACAQVVLARAAILASRVPQLPVQDVSRQPRPRPGKCSRTKRVLLGVGLGAGGGVIAGFYLGQHSTGLATTNDFMRVSVPTFALVGAVAGMLSCRS